MIELKQSSSESDTDVLLPPTTSRPIAHPKKQRMRSGGEHVGARIQHCGRCEEEGNSKRTCTNPLILFDSLYIVLHVFNELFWGSWAISEVVI